MSAETEALLDKAIRDHVADEYPDNLVASWVTIVERLPVEDDGATWVADFAPDSQSNVTTVGLSYLVTRLRSQAFTNE